MEVGDYVRTKYGEICKLKLSKLSYLLYETDIEIDRHNDRDCNDFGFDSDTINDIVKSSPNIIDLIEVGDYVNGCYVDEIIGANDSWDDRQHFHLLKFNSYFGNSDIKSIVTHEQMEQMKYMIGE